MDIKCSICEKVKDSSNFYKRKDRERGYLGGCKKCRSLKGKERRKNKPKLSAEEKDRILKKWIKSGADARRGKSKYANDEEKLEAKRKQARDYVKRSYSKNPEKWKKCYKEYWTNATEEQKTARKAKKLKYSQDFRKREPDKPKLYYQMLKDDWTGGVDCRDRKIWRAAELIVRDKLEEWNYKEIFGSGFKYFQFDWLAKKANKVYAFQVTTLRTRLIKKAHIELAKYLGLEFYIIHVKPTFDVLYMTKIDTSIVLTGKGKQYHHNKGKKIMLDESGRQYP